MAPTPTDFSDRGLEGTLTAAMATMATADVRSRSPGSARPYLNWLRERGLPGDPERERTVA